ncbi:cytochrome c oxidase subunit 7 [Fusarium flagelliforme]|uniref:Cytochrome c oxidase subunit 9, mitochondrial n=1 Tax=Fusarium flagelliforme TaxID=2675880 RepID=A0A395MN06_9HYPO|nr:cytochrome c oxidase subunit 7 [Fusarium flagelliforme]
MPVKPINGMLRRNLVLDLSIALGFFGQLTIRVMWLVGEDQSNKLTSNVAGSGFVMANFFWYGFHMPRTNARDNYYIKLEEERAAQKNE